MNWLNLSDDNVLKLAEAESEFPIAVGYPFAKPTVSKRVLRVTMKREVILSAVSRRKTSARGKLKQKAV